MNPGKSAAPMKPDLAVLYEHPTWFRPLFDALDRRGIAMEAIRFQDHCFDPASKQIPAPVILSRVAMSGFLREPEHGNLLCAGPARPLGGQRRPRPERRASARHRLLQGPPVLAHRRSRSCRPCDPHRPPRRDLLGGDAWHGLAAAGQGQCRRRRAQRSGRYDRPRRARRVGRRRHRRRAASTRCCSSRTMCRRAAARSSASRRWAAASSTRSRSRRAATASTSARPTPASPGRAARRCG